MKFSEFSVRNPALSDVIGTKFRQNRGFFSSFKQIDFYSGLHLWVFLFIMALEWPRSFQKTHLQMDRFKRKPKCITIYKAVKFLILFDLN